MNILLGIGNPEKEYEFTRHNVGHTFVDSILKKYKTRLKPAKGDYLEADISISGQKLKVIKSLVFMNHSGIVARQLFSVPFLSLSKFIVVLDDFQLPLGSIRIKRWGSSGGHRGLESIIYSLGSDRFPRLRIGIGPYEDDPVDFVLSRFTNSEMEVLKDSFDRGIRAIQIFVEEGINGAMNYANQPQGG